MSATPITEKDGVHAAWYEAAKATEMTMESLPEFLRKLTQDYQHDYGTICHAIAAAMTAAMSAVDRSPAGGITGFQASCVMWEVLQHAFHEKGPMRLVRFDKLLYPQYAEHFTTIPKSTWEWAREQAQAQLLKATEYMHPDVRAHLQSIAEHGVVPFGLTINND